MALITRVSRLFRADLHAVLDRIEEPELLLAQSIREMEEELARERQQIVPLQREQRQLAAREADTVRTLEGLEEELEVCFDSGEEELARTLIRRRLEAQHYRKFIAAKRDSLEQRLSALQERTEENRQRLEEMRQQTELLGGDDSDLSDEWNRESWERSTFRVRDEEVEVAFLREKQKRRLS